MANYLAAIGNAAPALIGSWREILAEERAGKKFKMEEQLQPARLEREQAHTEQMNVGNAISRETLQAAQLKNKLAKEEYDKGEVPVNMKEGMDSAGILPDWQDKVMAYAKTSGLNGPVIKTREGKKFMEDLFKGPLGKQLIVDHYSYYNDLLKQSKEGYDKARSPDIEGKTLEPEKLAQLQGKMQKFKQQRDMWMTLDVNLKDFAKRQIEAEELTGQLEDFVAKNPNISNKWTEEEMASISLAAKTGDVAAFNKALQGAGKVGKAEKKIEKTVDLGNKVRYHYSDGTMQDVPKEKDEKIERTIDLGDSVEIHFSGGRVETRKKGIAPKSPKDMESEQRKIGKDAAVLRKEFTNLKEVKDFKEVRTKFQVMQEALKVSTKTNNFVAVDQALITLFNKMTDPQSVVRESEYARTPKDLSVINKIKGKASKILSGGAGLTQDERNALVDMSKNFRNVYAGHYKNSVVEYRKLANMSGLDPNMIVEEEKQSGQYKSMSNDELLKALEK